MIDPTVRVGIIGVGNCARALVEGTAYYRLHPKDGGLMHETIGPYGPGSIEPAVAWDVDRAKVGRPVSEAIYQGENLEVGISLDWDEDALLGVGSEAPVLQGPRLDGIGREYAATIDVADDLEPGSTSIFGGAVKQVRDHDVDVLLNYLPVGSQEATEFWANVALSAGVAFVNNVPVFIARNQAWRDRFASERLPLIGDDIKSQLGATYLHRLLVRAFKDRGIVLDRTYQLNVGGNMDFKNMLEESRLVSKRQSKTLAVTDAYGPMDPDDVHIGPSDYVKWLGDTKIALIRCEGRGFGGAPIKMDVTLEVPDSPNSAGVVIDAARIAKLAVDRDEPQVDRYASAWLFKAPPTDVADVSDHRALERLNEWLAE